MTDQNSNKDHKASKTFDTIIEELEDIREELKQMKQKFADKNSKKKNEICTCDSYSTIEFRPWSDISKLYILCASCKKLSRWHYK